MAPSLLDWSSLSLTYEPFPIGLARPVLPPALYAELLDSWPAPALFRSFPKVGHKYAFSRKLCGPAYGRWLGQHRSWREFDAAVRDPAFAYGLVDMLAGHHVALGYARRSAAARLRKLGAGLLAGRLRSLPPRLGARLEFSMLPAAGGHILPHTDSPGKAITVVLAMPRPGEWDPRWGGGTDVNRPRERKLAFNALNRQAPFEAMEVIGSYPFEPNQALIFVKTFNSWHSVRPMTGSDPATMRRTLTINVEEQT